MPGRDKDTKLTLKGKVHLIFIWYTASIYVHIKDLKRVCFLCHNYSVKAKQWCGSGLWFLQYLDPDVDCDFCNIWIRMWIVNFWISGSGSGLWFLQYLYPDPDCDFYNIWIRIWIWIFAISVSGSELWFLQYLHLDLDFCYMRIRNVFFLVTFLIRILNTDEKKFLYSL